MNKSNYTQATTRDLISRPLDFDLNMDSDEVEAALAQAKLTPDCPIDQAFKAIAVWQMPSKRGAPRGNTNRAVSDPRNHTVRFRVNAEEFALLERRAGGESIGTWVRDVALKAAKQTEE